ncbi:Holliday junction resolvase RuvX [filamentous cyanobacterium LEGE 11480]|uniref:Putative pre-16S rRNA nuclease n=1 Tax=Romeriopsis navalis LEGE 11480 TaxID=2777977 RepID=A0A928VR76_9CYAN|nr:Holliday junction resolvase RuvX [Romeriopsis navalis]MBE9032288.1 Holliday junction resolvase RuvX [Romeriopsis navalis LEGE 11480]
MTEPLVPSVLALDIGKKRIGVAGCDRLGLFANGLMTIDRKSLPQVIDELQRLVDEREVTLLVIGMPYLMDGTVGAQAKNTRKTGKTIAKALALPIVWVDERLTSFAAEELLKAEHISPSRNKGAIDRKAAAIILQQWLDDRRLT